MRTEVKVRCNAQGHLTKEIAVKETEKAGLLCYLPLLSHFKQPDFLSYDGPITCQLTFIC